MRTLLAVAVAVALPQPALADAPPPEFYVLTGHVVTETSETIARARVEITCTKPARIHSDGHGDSSAWRGETDDHGRFASSHRLRGDCTVVVTAAGYVTASLAAAVPRTRDVTVKLARLVP